MNNCSFRSFLIVMVGFSLTCNAMDPTEKNPAVPAQMPLRPTLMRPAPLRLAVQPALAVAVGAVPHIGHPDFLHICHECLQGFASFLLLERHRRLNHAPECVVEAAEPESFERFLEPTQTVLSAVLASRSLSSTVSPINVHDHRTRFVQRDGKFRCTGIDYNSKRRCVQKFETQESLDDHVKRMHGVRDDIQVEHGLQNCGTQPIRCADGFKCPFCPNTYKDSRDCEEHISKTHLRLRRQCPYCLKLYVVGHRSFFARHIKQCPGMANTTMRSADPAQMPLRPAIKPLDLKIVSDDECEAVAVPHSAKKRRISSDSGDVHAESALVEHAVPSQVTIGEPHSRPIHHSNYLSSLRVMPEAAAQNLSKTKDEEITHPTYLQRDIKIVYQCNFCKDLFNGIDNCQTHIENLHRRTRKSVDILDGHITKIYVVHDVAVAQGWPQTNDHEKVEPCLSSDGSRFLYQCNFCGTLFNGKYTGIGHIKSQHFTVYQQCPLCQRNYADLDGHMTHCHADHQ